ncbi:MAG TPA: carbohydrate ABC transporter permease, partial [Trueperaceae bacterium]
MTKSQARVIRRVFFYLLIGVIFVYLMFPFYWAIVSALKTQAELIRTPATLWPDNPVLTNFRAVLS